MKRLGPIPVTIEHDGRNGARVQRTYRSAVAAKAAYRRLDAAKKNPSVVGTPIDVRRIPQ